MTRVVGVGVIGMGWMGTVHSRSYLHVAERFRDERVQPRLIVCADDVEERAKEGREQFGFQRHTVRWQEVTAAPDVQVVNVATPNHMHLAVVEAAAAAGKHIFCEKPVGKDPRETAEIERLAREAGVLTFVGVQLPMGSTGPVRAAADQGGEAGQTHPLSEPLFCRLRFQPTGCAFVALSAGVRRSRCFGRSNVPRGGYEFDAGRPHQACCG